MPVLTVYRHGMTAGTPPPTTTKRDAVPRGDVQGWSVGATRRNTAFLRSIREDHLDDGPGYALTLTLRTCPATPADWQRLRDTWEKRVRRLGMIRMHWVTEWTRRRVPHLHCAIWFRDAYQAHKAIQAWLDLTAYDGTTERGQHLALLDHIVGWFQYMSKHSSRGAKHYQRNPESVPEAWQKKTGRMWGKSGNWPIQPPVKVHLDNARGAGDRGYYVYRRIVRGWRVAEARGSNDWNRVRLARKMLSSTNRGLSDVRGVSEWLPYAVNLRVLHHLVNRGLSVTA